MGRELVDPSVEVSLTEMLPQLPGALSHAFQGIYRSLYNSLDLYRNMLDGKPLPSRTLPHIARAITDSSRFTEISGLLTKEVFPTSSLLQIHSVNRELTQKRISGDACFQFQSKKGHPDQRDRSFGDTSIPALYTTAGLMVDCVTDIRFPDSDIAFAKLLSQIVPNVFEQADEYSVVHKHRWAQREVGVEEPNGSQSLAILNTIHKKSIEESEGHYKATGVMWVREPEELSVNWWGDTKVIILAREKYPVGRPKILFESPISSNDIIDELTISAKSHANNPLLTDDQRLMWNEFAQRFIKSTYNVKFNSSEPGSFGALGFRGEKDFQSFVQSKNLKLSPDYDYLFLAWSDGFKGLSEIFRFDPIEFAMCIHGLSVELGKGEDLANLLIRHAVGEMERKNIPRTIEDRGNIDDITLFVGDLNGASASWTLSGLLDVNERDRLTKELLRNPVYSRYIEEYLKLVQMTQ